MPRVARKRSAADLYHVTIRGVGRQLIFEDDIDRRSFLRRLHDALDAEELECFAWCLMDNHVHMLLESPLPILSAAMREIGSGYALYFNTRHDRTGHLFQGRFGSEPLRSDEQLLATIRYIHLNPTKAYGAPAEDYPWSSYSELAYGGDSIANRDRVLSLFGGVDRFAAFHERGCSEGEVPRLSRCRVGNWEVERIAADVLGGIPASSVKSLPKTERNEILRRLRSEGLTIKQVERLTSVGRNIIARAK